MRQPRRPELLTIGEAFEDLVFLDLERLPNPGEEIKTSRFVRTIGGGALITAVAAARLGLRTEVWSGLSDLAAARLRAEKVTVRNLKGRREDHAVTAALSTRGNRTFVTYNGINDQLETRLLTRASRITARHVHFAFPPADCRQWLPILGRLGQRDVTTSWDFGWNEPLLKDRRFDELLRSVDVLFVNEQESLLYSRKRTAVAAFRYWQTFDNHVIVKLGAEGSRWQSSHTDLHVGAPRVRVVDTTGAGDAFNGGFLAAWLRGAPKRDVLRLGNRVGALSTRRAGGIDALPSEHEIPR